MHLFIIGNGFDRFHDVPCSYCDFNQYLINKNHTEHDKIGFLFNLMDSNWLWSDFENHLGELNEKNFVNANIGQWTHSKSSDIKNDYNELNNNLKGMFHAWVVDKLSNIKVERKLNLPIDSLFFNFNYTNYLESFYRIPRHQICYIHGDTANNNMYRPVVGHGKVDRDIDIMSRYFRFDIKEIVSGSKYIPDFFRDEGDYCNFLINESKNLVKCLRKDTDYYLKENNDFFELLKHSNIDKIYVLGHSLAKVDMPYFHKIAKCVDHNVQWYVSYFGQTHWERVKDWIAQYHRFIIAMYRYKKLPYMMKISDLSSRQV